MLNGSTGGSTQEAPLTRSAGQVLSAISLFTGAGGLDLGFEAAGFETRVAVEMDNDAVRVLRDNRPHWEVIDQNIESPHASSEHILQAGRLREGEANVLIGGPPCQPFSKSGYWAHGDAKRLEDPRANTLAAYLRVLRDTAPSAYLLENVPGLAFSEKDEGLSFLQRSIEEINRDLGTNYSFTSALVRATDHGIPQDRHRVFVVGCRNGTEFRFPPPTHAPSAPVGEYADPGQPELFASTEPSSLRPYLTAWDAIGDLEADDNPALRITGKWADLLPSIPEGKNYLHHTDRGGGVPLFGWRRRYWSFLLKLSKRLPSWTIAAQPGPAIGPFHWRNRRLSPLELMRIQTFPSGYRLSGSLRVAQRLVGNAVPSAMAERLALEIRRQLLGETSVSSDELTLVPKPRGDAPVEEPVAHLPSKYLSLIGAHDPHPGTGRGYAASRRERVADRSG